MSWMPESPYSRSEESMNLAFMKNSVVPLVGLKARDSLCISRRSWSFQKRAVDGRLYRRSKGRQFLLTR